MNKRSFSGDWLILPVAGLLLMLVLWAASSVSWAKRLPSPLKTWEQSKLYVTEPLAKRGELDQGILRFAWNSLILVAKGYTLALLVGVPLGFMMGSSPLFTKMFDPLF